MSPMVLIRRAHRQMNDLLETANLLIWLLVGFQVLKMLGWTGAAK